MNPHPASGNGKPTRRNLRLRCGPLPSNAGPLLAGIGTRALIPLLSGTGARTFFQERVKENGKQPAAQICRHRQLAALLKRPPECGLREDHGPHRAAAQAGRKSEQRLIIEFDGSVDFREVGFSHDRQKANRVPAARQDSGNTPGPENSTLFKRARFATLPVRLGAMAHQSGKRQLRELWH